MPLTSKSMSPTGEAFLMTFFADCLLFTFYQNTPTLSDVLPAPSPLSDVLPAPSPLPDVLPAPSPLPDVLPAPSPLPDVLPAPSPLPDVLPAPSPVCCCLSEVFKLHYKELLTRNDEIGRLKAVIEAMGQAG